MHLPRGIESAEAESARSAGTIVKCIMIRGFKSKCIFSHVVPCNGADEERYVARQVADDLAWLGYGELAIKADNEPSLTALLKVASDESLTKRNGITITTEAQQHIICKATVHQELE